MSVVEAGERQRLFAPVDVRVASTAAGELILTSGHALGDFPDRLLDKLDHWAATTPDRVYLAERGADGAWIRRTFADVKRDVDTLAARLLPLGLSVERPLGIVALNGIRHAELMLAAQRIGVPAAIISPGYAMSASQAEKLKHIFDLATPGVVFADNPSAIAAALDTVAPDALRLAPGPAPAQVIGLEDIVPASPEAVAAAYAATGPDTIAKLLFTSGSTGMPKGVVNTQRMMVSNQKALAIIWPFLNDEPPVMVDWLPWNHTFGGNCCFNQALYFGGSFYIDQGKPLPKMIGQTVENLRDVSPTIYFNVPVGYEALLPFLETDAAFAEHFFSKVNFLFNAGAAMPAPVRERLAAAARKAVGHVPPIIGAWGSTETAPFSTAIHFETPHAENLGVPIPGTAIKMVPNHGKMELRVKGPNVMPGYWRQPDATDAAFDEDGYYKIADAGRFAEADRPDLGILYDGRTAENFKLSSGTWVNVGALRLAAISAAKPFIQDAVVTGHGRDDIGLMIFPNIAAARAELGAAAEGLSDAEVAEHPEIAEKITAALATYNAGQLGSSTRIVLFVVLPTPPDPASHEITEKGYINQRAVLAARADDVERVYTCGHCVPVTAATPAKAALSA